MDEVSDDLVTVAVVQTSTEANLVKNQLDAAGIKAFLGGEEAVAMAWHMAGAFGGIKVQVASSEAEDALSLLDRKAWQDQPDDEKYAVATAETLDKLHEDEDEVLSDREKNANVAVRAAVFGLLFWPLELYAGVLLFKIIFSKEKLEGRTRTNAKIATGFIAAAVLLLCLLVLSFLGWSAERPAQRALDLRQLSHPQILVGTWEGELGKEARLSIQVRGNGTIHYRKSGAAPMECTGPWAYENHTLLACYDTYLQGDSTLKGQLQSHDVDNVQAGEMLLRDGPDKVRMLRIK